MTGMKDGPGSVSTLILVVVRSTEEVRDDDNGEGDWDEDVDKVDKEGTPDARTETTRVRTADVHMNAQL